MNLGLPSFTNSLGITRPRHRPFFTAPAITVLDIIMVPGGVGEGGGDDQSLLNTSRARAKKPILIGVRVPPLSEQTFHVLGARSEAS
jgi:hypothetical protein